VFRSKHVLALGEHQYVTSEETLSPAAEIVLLGQMRLQLFVALVTDRGDRILE